MTTDIPVQLYNVRAEPGDVVTLPLRIYPSNGARMAAVQCKVRYPIGKVQFLTVKGLNGWSPTANANNPGVIHLSIPFSAPSQDNQWAPEGEVKIARLKFLVLDGTTPQPLVLGVEVIKEPIAGPGAGQDQSLWNWVGIPGLVIVE
jgi:hypothetical protein|tara:strand:- start:3138 stop:3575 length:438 start_codon:yes stop_codon:yes gene_type:complete